MRSLSPAPTVTALAQQYYESDFDWQEHQLACAPIITAQQQPPSSLLPQPNIPAYRSVEPWEEFHARSGASFYKERRYILREFPMLLHSSVRSVHQSSDDAKHDPCIRLSPSIPFHQQQHTRDTREGVKAAPEHQVQEGHPASHDRRDSGSSQPLALVLTTDFLVNSAHSSLLQGPHLASPSDSPSPDQTLAPSKPITRQQQATSQLPGSSVSHSQANDSISDNIPACSQAEQGSKAASELQSPALTTHIVELGCGSGASLLPILRANAHCHVTGTDISPTSLQHFLAAAQREGIAPERIHTFPADAASSLEQPRMTTLAADICLIVFTLSALTPAQQSNMMHNAHTCLVPGGHLMIRDHGLYDMAQMRMEPGQWRGEGQLYARKDGTLAYFFSVDELCARAADAGFTMLECKYATVRNLNRKTGAVLKRVFIHGLFVRSL